MSAPTDERKAPRSPVGTQCIIRVCGERLTCGCGANVFTRVESPNPFLARYACNGCRESVELVPEGSTQ